MSRFSLFLKNNTRYTIENFRYLNHIKKFRILYEELKAMRKMSYIEKNEDQCKDTIQYIIEYLVYGDKKDPNFFEYLVLL